MWNFVGFVLSLIFFLCLSRIVHTSSRFRWFCPYIHCLTLTHSIYLSYHALHSHTLFHRFMFLLFLINSLQETGFRSRSGGYQQTMIGLLIFAIFTIDDLFFAQVSTESTLYWSRPVTSLNLWIRFEMLLDQMKLRAPTRNSVLSRL